MNNVQKEIHDSIKPLAMIFLEDLSKYYLFPLYNYIKENPELVSTVSGFLINFEKIIIYVGRNHIAVEYLGSETVDVLPSEDRIIELEIFDYTKSTSDFFELIIGFEYDSTSNVNLPLLEINQDYILPTNKGFTKLSELGWNFIAQDSILCFNFSVPEVKEDKFARIINGFFFDADDSGLKTRHIKWLDFFPISYDDTEDETDSISFDIAWLNKLVEYDANYKYPLTDDYKFSKLPKINRFIEIWGNKDSSESDITTFLAKKENAFILSMRFGAESSYSELTCEWQSEKRDSIRPDFFVLQSNGFADIVEFKLPSIDKNFMVGSSNRESFSAWLNSYISQTRVYKVYFNDPNNREWFEKKYGFKVYHPKRILVVGRRSNFDSVVWREIISDYKDIEIMNFDDLIDGVVAQFYK